MIETPEVKIEKSENSKIEEMVNESNTKLNNSLKFLIFILISFVILTIMMINDIHPNQPTWTYVLKGFTFCVQAYIYFRCIKDICYIIYLKCILKFIRKTLNKD